MTTQTDQPTTDSTAADAPCSIVLGSCKYCGSDLIRDQAHSCDESETEFAREPFYAVPTNTGFAIRDARSRCVGTLSFRDWLSKRAKDDAREKLINVFKQ